MTAAAFPLWSFLADARRDRLRAIRELAVIDDDAAFALRRVLYTDRDAHVRAAAARTLGGFATSEPWLLEAIDDRSPLVRDTLLRALARCGSHASRPALRTLIERDSIWWVRRSAIYALAAVSVDGDVATFTAALADPFWRVRHAAVRVLAVLGARDPDVRDAVLDAPPTIHGGTLSFLRGTWGPVAIEAPARASAPSALPAALLDPDPAVVTARLPHDPDVTPLALVELLCDPHVPLRDLASQCLAVSHNLDALEAALDWLEEPRIPHVVDTVHDLLDRLGEPALELAERALTRPDRPAATRWAIEWVVATQSETLYDTALERARAGSALVRRAALTLADNADLTAWACDPTLVDAIAVELHARRAYAELASLDGSAHPRTRALQIDAVSRQPNPDWSLVEPALSDAHPGPRAIAARWLVRANQLDALDVVDPDPTVREAALHAGASTDAAIAALGDTDPWVRRAAIRALVIATRDAEMLPDHVVIAAISALDSPDPGICIAACELPLVDDRQLARVLACTSEPNPGVRAAASQALHYLPDSEIRLRALLDSRQPPSTRALAYSWLFRRLDAEALAHARLAYDRETDSQVRTLLAGVIAAITATTTVAATETATDTVAATVAVAAAATATDSATATVTDVLISPMSSSGTTVDVLISPISTPASANVDGAISQRDAGSRVNLISQISKRADTPSSAVEHRPFGRAGFDVAPLAISGAFDLPTASLEAAEGAGVNLMFWEPGYDVLARFLRKRPHLRVVTGTYHGDAASIRGDVNRALRILERDTLDAFLLFWTRSPARVDAAAFAALDALKRTGKVRAIGFSTHHRDIAKQAIETRPWDVVMIRHSAAHPGIETELLPTARDTQTAIVTFSALTYGRMTAGVRAPSPVECYRYSLAQRGVTACISAPRRQEELEENLGALVVPSMSDERIAEMRVHGIGVRVESQRFNTLLRQPTRDAAAAAREMLASEQPPSDVRMPSPTAARRSRTRLGGRRRR